MYLKVPAVQNPTHSCYLIMNKAILFAPHIDGIIEGFNPKSHPVSYDAYLKLVEIYDVFSKVKAGSDDEVRHTWIHVERGPIEAFGDYDEFLESGEVESPEEFEKLWKDYYPEETKWYKFQTAKYIDEKFFYLDSKLFARIKEEYTPSDDESLMADSFNRFIDLFLKRIKDDMDKLEKDPVAYNNYIRENLPCTKRYGKIKRQEYWDLLGKDAYRPEKNLDLKTISKLEQFFEGNENGRIPLLKEMTANTFFRICEICYDANDYFKNWEEAVTPRGKYLEMADGRDAGLAQIDGASPEAFYKWYHSGKMLGAHPWESCRGGNSTHISLYIAEKDDKWFLCLEGSSFVRVAETVRMAVALFDNKIPLELRDAEEIVRMVTGRDYIGIVPEHLLPSYCHSSFPKEDKIFDFMNLGFDRDQIPAIAAKTTWYPLEEIYLAT